MDLVRDSSTVSRARSLPQSCRNRMNSFLTEPQSNALSISSPSHARQVSSENLNNDYIDATDPHVLKEYFGEEEFQVGESASRISNVLLTMSQDPEMKGDLNVALLSAADEEFSDDDSRDMAQQKVPEFMEMEQKAQAAYRAHGERFPTAIWHCCKNLCFASIAMDPKQFKLLDELILIHNYANRCHSAHEKLHSFIATRRRGIGTSTLAFVSDSRSEREASHGEVVATERQKALREFANFAMEVLPFFYSQTDSPRGTARPKSKMCTQAICCLLGVSRNFLYNRTTMQNPNGATEDELTSLVDYAGVRLRQRRRNGDRSGYPALQNMRAFDCGCDTPCFSAVPQWTLASEYTEFISFARQLRPRHKENRFLLNRLYCPLTNRTTSVCNRALSVLYTVSESLVADVRRAIDVICDDPTLEERPLLSNGSLRYRYDRKHPINRYPDTIRERIESHLDMVLRADPSGSNGASVCRVYSPEINTQEKLRKVLRDALGTGDCSETGMSASTLQRMVNEYLRGRNYSAISFSQSDHNACPNCKTLHYAILQYHHEALLMKREIDVMSHRPRPFLMSDQRHYEALSEAVASKKFQENECLKTLTEHNSRDKRIRGTVKTLSDYFRVVENQYLAIFSNETHMQGQAQFVGWNMFPDRACFTHQDDMSKLDLPHFVVSASSDITRWRFDVNGHVSAVNNDAIVLSHEQGTGPKNASAIMEEILINHLLTCRGESIRIIVSDNAAVGKNWLTTIALPQYFVDQGLAEIVLVIFLENNHGKWLADMLFGQFQSRRRRAFLLGIDDMLSGFESVNRKIGTVRGFAMNPLSSVDFAAVLQELGYETKPPSGFGFQKRNIHFAGACIQGAKCRLPVKLRELLGHALPDDAGMVRISTEPPGRTAQSQLSYEERVFDVPAARLNDGIEDGPVGSERGSECDTPLVVPCETPYAPSGNGVVSTRTAEHVGYNGIEFRKLNACPEMRNNSNPVIRQAWPNGLLELRSGRAISEEPVAGSESIKCAPVNWVVRRPVKYFSRSVTDWTARYPPRNLLNAKYRKGPWEEDPWTPTATYHEPPFPIIEGTAACAAMEALAAKHHDICKPVNFLQVLRAVYEEMGDREDAADKWLQRRATKPSAAAVHRYREELAMYVAREKDHPKAPKTLTRVFKEDERVLAQASRLMSLHSVSGTEQRMLRNQILSRLFEEAERTPGALDRFYHLVEKEQERYAGELREFRKRQEQFDRENGLLALI